MTYTDYRRQARSYSARAAAATRRAEADAQRAADAYATAVEAAGYAAWLTQRPELWQAELQAPADLEARAGSWARIGDIYLASSFRETASAAHSRELAARYRAMAAERDARLAALAAECEAELRAADARDADETDEPSECAICVPGQCPGPGSCPGWTGTGDARREAAAGARWPESEQACASYLERLGYQHAAEAAAYYWSTARAGLAQWAGLEECAQGDRWRAALPS